MPCGGKIRIIRFNECLVKMAGGAFSHSQHLSHSSHRNSKNTFTQKHKLWEKSLTAKHTHSPWRYKPKTQPYIIINKTSQSVRTPPPPLYKHTCTHIDASDEERQWHLGMQEAFLQSIIFINIRAADEERSSDRNTAVLLWRSGTTGRAGTEGD